MTPDEEIKVAIVRRDSVQQMKQENKLKSPQHEVPSMTDPKLAKAITKVLVEKQK